MALTIQRRLTTDIVAAVQALKLQGTDGVTGPIDQKVFDQLIPEKLSLQSGGLPACIVETAQRPLTIEDAWLEERLYTFRVRVWILDVMRPNFQACQQDYESWIATIWTKFDPRSGILVLPNTAEFRWAEHGGTLVLEEEAARKQLAKGYVDLLCKCTEVKTDLNQFLSLEAGRILLG